MFRNPKLHLKALIGALLLGSGISLLYFSDVLISEGPVDGIKLALNFILPWATIWLLEIWGRLIRSADPGGAAGPDPVDAGLLKTTSALAEEVAVNASKVNQLAQSRLQYTQQASVEAKSLTLESDVMVALSRVSRDRIIGLERIFEQLDRLLQQRNNDQLQTLIGELRQLLRLYRQRYEEKGEHAERLSLFAEQVNQLSLTLAIEAARHGKHTGDELVVPVDESRELAFQADSMAEQQQQQVGELATVVEQLDDRLQVLEQYGMSIQQWQVQNAQGIRRQFAELQDNIEQLGQRASKQVQLTAQVTKRLGVLTKDAEGAMQGAQRNCTLGEQIRTQLKQALDELES